MTQKEYDALVWVLIDTHRNGSMTAEQLGEALKSLPLPKEK